MTLGAGVAVATITPESRDLLWHRAVFETGGETTLVELSDDADLPTGGWEAPPTLALSVPLRRIGEQHPYGYLIVGLNPFRLLDDDYRSFVELVGAQLSAAIARANAFEQERDRVEQLAELDRAKTTFFTNVSHELRTPLTLLLGPAEDALNDNDHELAPEQRRRVEIIQRNSERLLKLVNTLLDFSRLESGRVQATYEPLDLTRYTAELASMFESAYRRSDLTLTIDCDPLPSRPFVDREMWAKIVLNLMSNALKATFAGGVTVRLSDEHTHALLEVTDTGVGIPAAEQGRLFERFHRVSGAQLRTHEGSGIGLALVAELARLHGGEVAVESEVGVGSTFRVTIPYGRDHLDGTQVADREVDDVPEAARYSAGYLAEAQRWLGADGAQPEALLAPPELPEVLVVDDNPDMREYVRGLLVDDYVVATAPDGAAALQQVRARQPDLVLTDVMMPVLDGFGLLRSIREDPDLKHIPVVMLSARSGDEATIEGLEAGADDYLVKPFSARELLARVRANLELDRVRQLVTELQRYREILDHAESLAHVGSWEVDVEKNAVRMSPEIRRIGGLPDTDEVSYEAARGLVDPDDQDMFERAMNAALVEHRPFDITVRGMRTDGATFLMRIRGAGIRDADGKLALIRGSTQDITEQRATEVAMARAQADREAAAREHAIATELQQSLLPSPTFDANHLEIAAYYRPGVAGTQVGGDWHDVIDLGDGRTAVMIGDVMGRGVRAAAVMGQLRAAGRAYARLDMAPADLIRLLDDTVREVSEETIVTCVYAVYDPTAQTLTYANAGHLPPLVVEPGKGARRLVAGGPPLGAGTHGDIDETVALPNGTLLTLYTDGLVERRGSDLDTGIDKLADVLTNTDAPLVDLPSLLVDRLVPDGPDDDVAILLCRASESTGEDRFARHDVAVGSGALSESRRFVGRTLAGWEVSDALAFDVSLAASELVTNAIHHGARPIQLRLRKQRDHLVLEVRDSGPGVPNVRHSQPDAVSGRGLLIVSQLAERWGIRPGPAGKTVWAQFRLPTRDSDQVLG